MVKVGLLIIATSKYFDFVEPLLESSKRFFLPLPEYRVTPFVFTDKSASLPDGVTKFLVKHRPWPMSTLLRFHMFLSHRQHLEEMDYLFYCDADMRFVDTVGEEVIGETVGTVHPLFYDKPRGMLVGYEERQDSQAYISPDKGRRYYQAAFFGGRTANFMAIAAELAECINTDLNRDIIAKWHDESHLNRFFADYPPSVELTPAYCYPEGMSLPFKPKIIGLKKDNAKMRTEKSLFSRFFISVKNKIACRQNC